MTYPFLVPALIILTMSLALFSAGVCGGVFFCIFDDLAV